MGHCIVCKKESKLISELMSLCSLCIKEKFNKVLPQIKKTIKLSREKFNLPSESPQNSSGINCDFCVNECKIREDNKGYCGLKINKQRKLIGPTSNRGFLSWYYDPLPTNCVGDWVCAGGTGVGYPEFSNSKGPEYGFKNLAVFYHGCSFNCLFCQNWHFKEELGKGEGINSLALAGSVDSTTSCICYFGGDPAPQISHALKTSSLALKQRKDKILRICWETNGSMHPRFLEKMLKLSLTSGGCIKFDLKSWNEKLHVALCGVSNRRTIENFTSIAKMTESRKEPPLLIASTLLVPGYVDENEISQIARFIASLDSEIPYSLLGFYPHFYMSDLPHTSRHHAESCLQAALDAGLKRVRIGNLHLLGDSY